MKTTGAGAFIFSFLAMAISASAQNSTAPASAGNWAVSEKGPHHRIWERTEYESAPDGTQRPHVHRYTELGSGLNFKSPLTGEWIPSSEQIVVLPDGSAAATNGQHQVFFPANIAKGVIELVTPEGRHLKSRPMGVSYFDGTNSVLIAELKDSVGHLVASNVLVYANAFTDIKADLVMRYTKAGFEQDLVFREQPPEAEAFGMSSEKSRVEVLTEFFNTEEPVIRYPRGVQNGISQDPTLTFGSMKMVHGKAFKSDSKGTISQKHQKISVEKSWMHLPDPTDPRVNRTFLIEQIPVKSLRAQMHDLPQSASINLDGGAFRRASTVRQLPQIRSIAKAGESIRMASADILSGDGYVMDYQIVNSIGNYTFQSDTTYYVNDFISIDFAIVEGGTVIKFAPIECNINCNGIECQTEPYRPAVLTARDDNSVGETISGSTGQPSGYYASSYGNYAFTVYNDYGTPNLKNFRFNYLEYAFILYTGSADNLVVGNCRYGFGDYNVRVNNGLFYGLEAVATYGPVILFGNHLTIASCQNLGDQAQDVTLILTNSIIYQSYVGNTSISTNCVALLNWNAANPFNSVGAGKYYLSTNSPYRNAGTTNISGTLLSDLRKKTTYPPVVYSNTTLSSNVTFSIQAQRDLDAPDLGYHYDPLDYVFGGVTMNSNVTFTAGVAIGWFELPGSGGPGYGLSIANDMTATWSGIATNPCVFARYSNVQEGGNGIWTEKGWLAGIRGLGSFDGNHPAIINATFLKSYHLASGPCHFRDYWNMLQIRANHCEFYSGAVGGYNTQSYYTNCLFERVNQGNSTEQPSAAYVLRNCTLRGGILGFNHNEYSAPYWYSSVKDCALDGTVINGSDPSGGNPLYVSNGNNAYLAGSNTVFSAGANNVTNSTFNWQSNSLGNYYLPSNSTLINAGSRTAGSAGLYHFTTQTNQVKETNSTVDIGYHYVALSGNGTPVDTDSDGTPDYLEDVNGNGTNDSGEGAWSLAISTQPASQTAYVGDDITFTVLASGATPFTYQWMLNGTNLAGATNSILAINNVTTNNGGSYSVVVSNVGDSITSSTATLTVNIPAYTVLSTSVTNYTFKGDTTYYINGGVELFGNTTIEGGTVIKFSSSNACYLHTDGGTITCQTAPYRPAIFTSRDDNSVGYTISKSTGVPTIDQQNYYLYLYRAQATLHDLRMSYCYCGITVESANADLSDMQFVHCSWPIWIMASPNCSVRNVLMSDITSAAFEIFQSSVGVEHLTLDQCAQFGYNDWNGQLNVTNSLLVAVASMGDVPYTTNNVVIVGTSTGVFQTVGAGSHYLASNSSYRNAGTTTINSNLLAEFKYKTTYPPILLTNTVSTNTTLIPQAPRDSDGPDLGYHYDPIDYLVWMYTVTNATLTVSNGAVIACYNDTGILATDGSSVISIGTPLAPNWFTRYSAVQENPVSLGLYAPSSGIVINPYRYNFIAGKGVFRFSKFSCPADGGSHLYHANGNWTYTNLLVQDCEMWGGSSYFGGNTNSVAVLMNNLFSRGIVNSLSSSGTNVFLALSNNLFWNVKSIVIRPGANTATWFAFNNVFDTCTFGPFAGTNGVNDFNGYINCNKQLNPTNANNVVLTGFTYTNGPLGSFYQLSTNFTDKGSVSAGLTSLYHYTTQTAQTKETNSVVDLGYHYIAVDSSGLPLDLDGNGLADYLEDCNGDGIVDSHTNGVACVQAATLSDPGTLSFTVTNISAGMSVAAPVLTSPATFSYGLEQDWVYYDCNSFLNHYETNLVAYTAGSIYFSPAIPASFPTPGSYVYTAMVDGTSGSALCSNVVGVIGTVTVNVLGTADSDYDGICDSEEILDGTNPNDPAEVLPVRLAYWRFDNTNSWMGDQGQVPLTVTGITGVPTWNTNAVAISNSSAVLGYRAVESNSCRANLNLRSGAIRFWYKPAWGSVSSGGVGPQADARLIEAGVKGTTNGWFALGIDSSGTNLWFGTQTNSPGTLTTNLSAVIGWTSNIWHQIVITYSVGESILYVDGESVTNGLGVAVYPGTATRQQGFSIGGTLAGTNQANGIFDELETFNYPIDSVSIQTDYLTAINRDTDGDGWPDIMEDFFGTNPYSSTSVPQGVTIDHPLNGSVISR